MSCSLRIGLALYSGVGVLLPLGLYIVGAAISLVAGHRRGLRRAVCRAGGRAAPGATRSDISNRSRWFVSVTGPPFCSLRSIVPDLLPVWVLGALVPVAFAEPYISWQRGLAFTVITAGCVLAMAALARFQNIANLGAHTPRGIQSAIFIPALAVLALYLLVIVWNNAAALRTSESLLAERAAEFAASRTRLITAADEERRRLERDLHDGAQQHLVALAVLIQLARTAEHDRYQPLLTEASGLLETAIAEIRRLAHGIYPPLLVSGGLAEALPAVAARAPVPVQAEPAGPRPLPRFDRGRPLFLLQRSAAECHQTRRPRHHGHDHRPCRRPDAYPHDQRHRPRIRPRDHRHRADQYDRPSVSHRRAPRYRHRARTWHPHHRRHRHPDATRQLGTARKRWTSSWSDTPSASSVGGRTGCQKQSSRRLPPCISSSPSGCWTTAVCTQREPSRG